MNLPGYAGSEELAETEAAIERLAGAAAKADAMRLGVTRLRSGNLIAYLVEAQVKWPTPHDGTDSDAWPQLASWLRSEAMEVVEGPRARSGGKPRQDAPKPRDMHPAATEWARVMASHFICSWSSQSAMMTARQLSRLTARLRSEAVDLAQWRRGSLQRAPRLGSRRRLLALLAWVSP